MKKHGRWVNQTLLRPLRRHRATGAQRSTVLPQQITGNVLRERGRVPYFLMPDYEQSGFTASLHPACPARSPFHAPLRQRGRFSGYPRPDAWNSPSHLHGFAREAVSFMHLSSRVAAEAPSGRRQAARLPRSMVPGPVKERVCSTRERVRSVTAALRAGLLPRRTLLRDLTPM